MDMYSVSGRNREAYLIQGTESNPRLTSPPLESFPTMYSEGGPEFLVEPGLYYPTATNYGYICTGFESPGYWDDHHRFFGLDGQEVQYSGAETESLPYVYYSPSYGYAESSYNPYYPYIPGAMLGVDDQSTGTQQYYTFPSYEIPMYSPAYYPTVFQSEPAIISSNGPAPLDTGSCSEKSVDGQGLKSKVPSPATVLTVPRPASNHTHSSARVSECCKANAGPSKLPAAQGNLISGSFSSAPLPHVLQVRGAQAVDNISQGKTSFRRSQIKMALSSGTGLSNFGSSANGQASVEKSRSKSYHGRVSNDVNGSPDASIQQNRYPRSNQSKNHFAVKAYSTRAGDSDAQGNIIIHSEQYNRDDFPIDYMNAKFFVIKSYSEDDVHKGIKYSVWSSTPNGNKKLQSAYDDASRIASGEKEGCPIFLFFSVNASGQFCGVAEMTGPVDFHKHMDFWQQDKWIGSFPVKWHFIKDVSNPNFRHIILENNENKPVTNSRDTQEIRYKQGIEMLKIFKNYKWKTSLLDDFMYYENRQKIMQEEKNRLLIKGYGSSFLIPALDPPRKHNIVFDITSGEEQKTTKPSELNGLDSDASSIILAEGSERITDEPKDDYISSVKIGSLTINPNEAVPKAEAASNVATVADTRAVEMLTVGSMPVRVNYGNSSGFLTFGTIPTDPPKPVHHDEADYTKSKTQR